jgi:polar amino acid transport system permease protein
MESGFDVAVIVDNYDVLLIGLAHTLEFTVICIAIGIVWGFLLALMRQGGGRVLATVAAGYVQLFRGTPVIIQLFWIFFCLPLILGVDLSNFASSVIALSLYMGAIACESFRQALAGIPRDHYDASTALGLSPLQRTIYVVLPQAVLLAVPNLLSNSVSLFKESALVSAVGMVDLMYVGRSISNHTARPIEVLTAVALCYFIVAFPITRVVTVVETRLRRRLAG